MKLVARHLATLPAGMHADGNGLYLRVRDNDARAWIFRYRDRVTGKLRDKGLGAFPAVSLAMARVEAEKARTLLRSGGDPIETKREAISAAKLERVKARTFADCRDAYIAAHSAGWRNPKHRAQWVNTLSTYAAILDNLPVRDIDTSAVLRVLEPIWATKTETASRVRGRIETILDWAKTRELRTGENPARWRGHLDKLLPKPTKVRTVKPHAALKYGEMVAFWSQLTAVDSLASRALQLQCLTATRPSEATAAHWREFDLRGKVWTIPSERMKAGRAHRVPLSDAAIATIKALPHSDGWLFPGSGRKPGPITIAAPYKLMLELRPGLTSHGLRSTFRDWAADCTSHPHDVCEMALAHIIGDKTEAAYRRGEMFERRARLMADWAAYCTSPPVSSERVTPIRRRKT